MTESIKPFDSTRSLQQWLEMGKTVLYRSRSIQCCLHRAACAVARTAESRFSLSAQSTKSTPTTSLTHDDFWKRRSVSAIDRMSELSASRLSVYSTLPLVGRLIGVGFAVDCCCWGVGVGSVALE